jgi:hypothetical protein
VGLDTRNRDNLVLIYGWVVGSMAMILIKLPPCQPSTRWEWLWLHNRNKMTIVKMYSENIKQ